MRARIHTQTHRHRHRHTYIDTYVTQRGSWHPSGKLGNSSKPIIKGYMEKNMKNRIILFKIFTSVEFH